MKLTHKCPAPLGALPPLVVALLLAGCGGGSAPSAGVARLRSSTGASAATGAQASSRGSGSPVAEALVFAHCMRSNGAPNYPDPSASGGFLFHSRAGVNPSSPAFRTAQAKCKRLMPPGPPTTTHPTSQVLAKMLAASQCMRLHGIHGFPDPRTSVPPNPFASSGGGVISDIEGVIFIFPQTIDMRSPAFTKAAAACAFPLHNH